MKNTLTCRLLCPKPIFFCEGNKVLYLNGDITLATLTLHCTILGTSSMIGKLTGCGGGKKNIVILTYKQQLLSIDMKTKVVQHVPRTNLSI